MASARRRKDCFTSFLFVLPLLTLFLVFFAYPIIYNIVISFYDWNGISVEKVFVGFANYKKLWADSVMQKTFRNFVIIAISTTVIQSALGLMLASFFIVTSPRTTAPVATTACASISGFFLIVSLLLFYFIVPQTLFSEKNPA